MFAVHPSASFRPLCTGTYDGYLDEVLPQYVVFVTAGSGPDDRLARCVASWSSLPVSLFVLFFPLFGVLAWILRIHASDLGWSPSDGITRLTSTLRSDSLLAATSPSGDKKRRCCGGHDVFLGGSLHLVVGTNAQRQFQHCAYSCLPQSFAVTQTAVMSCFSSDDCRELPARSGNDTVCVEFLPDGLHDASWDNVSPTTGSLCA